MKITGTKSSVKWSTSNKKIATVNSKGLVTAKAKGTAKIYGQVKGKKYTCAVTVSSIPFKLEFYTTSSTPNVLSMKVKNTSAKNIRIEQLMLLYTNNVRYTLYTINDDIKFISGVTIKAKKTGYTYFAQPNYGRFRFNSTAMCTFSYKYNGSQYIAVTDYKGKVLRVEKI